MIACRFALARPLQWLDSVSKDSRKRAGPRGVGNRATLPAGLKLTLRQQPSRCSSMPRRKSVKKYLALKRTRNHFPYSPQLWQILLGHESNVAVQLFESLSDLGERRWEIIPKICRYLTIRRKDLSSAKRIISRADRRRTSHPFPTSTLRAPESPAMPCNRRSAWRCSPPSDSRRAETPARSGV